MICVGEVTMAYTVEVRGKLSGVGSYLKLCMSRNETQVTLPVEPPSFLPSAMFFIQVSLAESRLPSLCSPGSLYVEIPSTEALSYSEPDSVLVRQQESGWFALIIFPQASSFAECFFQCWQCTDRETLDQSSPEQRLWELQQTTANHISAPGALWPRWVFTWLSGFFQAQPDLQLHCLANWTELEMRMAFVGLENREVGQLLVAL